MVQFNTSIDPTSETQRKAPPTPSLQNNANGVQESPIGNSIEKSIKPTQRFTRGQDSFRVGIKLPTRESDVSNNGSFIDSCSVSEKVQPVPPTSSSVKPRIDSDRILLKASIEDEGYYAEAVRENGFCHTYG